MLPHRTGPTPSRGARPAEAAFSFRGQGVGRHSTLHVGHVQNSRLLGPAHPHSGQQAPAAQAHTGRALWVLTKSSWDPHTAAARQGSPWGSPRGTQLALTPHRDAGSVQHPAQCALAQLFTGDWEARSPTATLTFCPWPRGQACFAISVLCWVSMTCEVTVWLRLGSGHWSIPGCWVHGALPWTDTGGSPVTRGPSQYFLECLLCGGSPGGGSRNFCRKPGTAGQVA